jgi:phosphate transport system substrate-binding protein
MVALDCIEGLNKTINFSNFFMKISLKLFTAAALLLIISSCTNPSKQAVTDTPSEGTIHISVEQSFKPFIDEQLKVFASSYPKANIIVHYKSEIECMKDLVEDSTRMVLVTRGLDKKEQEGFKTQLSFNPTFGILAYNAVAVIVHQQAKDTVFSMKDLQDRLTGKNQGTVVMDGTNLTGIVRFLKDSLAKNNTLGKNVMAAAGSQAVIEYVAAHPKAIGFVGMNWIGDTYDQKQAEYRKKVKTGLVECTLCIEKGYFSHPSPSTISQGQYSLSLPIYFILKENSPGLGSGFLNFMSLERGQLIFRRSFLVPAKMSFKERKGLL